MIYIQFCGQTQNLTKILKTNMTLTELIVAVKEKNLTKDQLEDYRDEMSHVYADMQMELADIEKEKAIRMEEMRVATPEDSEARLKGNWQSTLKGQREIVLKRYCLATKELLNSLKSRLYSIY